MPSTMNEMKRDAAVPIMPVRKAEPFVSSETPSSVSKMQQAKSVFEAPQDRATIERSPSIPASSQPVEPSAPTMAPPAPPMPAKFAAGRNGSGITSAPQQRKLSEPADVDDTMSEASDDADAAIAGPWYRRPVTSLELDNAVESRLPEDTAALLFWQDKVNSGMVLAALILGPVFVYANLGISKLLLLATIAEIAVVLAVGSGFIYQMIDKYALKNDPPRNLMDMYVGNHLRQAYSAVAALMPAREEIVDAVDSVIETTTNNMAYVWNACMNADIMAAVPVVVGLQALRYALRMVSISRVYFLSVLFFFTVPLIYRNNKDRIDRAVCPALEAIRRFSVRMSDNTYALLPPAVQEKLAAKPKAE